MAPNAACRPSRFGVLVVVLLSLAAGASASAGDVASSGEWSGSASLSCWSGSRRLDDAGTAPGASVWLKASGSLSDARFFAEGWLRSEDMSSRPAGRGRFREAYLSMALGNADVRIGRQVLVWGRADQLNPTDSLTPRDYTLLVPEPGDDRLGVDAVQLKPRWGATSLSVVWLPRFSPSVTPLPEGVRPGLPRSARQLALKLDNSGGGGTDWSVSWFSGFDLMPTLAPSSPGMLESRHPRIQVVGGDFAVPVGRLGLRGELAHTRTEDPGGTDPLKKNSFFYGVLGVERSFFGDLNVNVQAYAYRVQKYRDPRDLVDPQLRQLAVRQASLAHQLERSERGLAVRVSDKWWNETLEGEVAVVVSFGGQGHIFKPRLAYALNDHLRLTLGADIYRGRADSPYGLLQRNSLAYGELRAYF